MEGLLSSIFKQMSIAGFKLNPQLVNNEIKIEFTEQDFQSAITKNLDERARNAIRIEFHEGKMIIRIRLF